MEEINEIKASRFEIEQHLNQFIGSLKVDNLRPEAKVILVKLKIELSKVMKDIEEYRKTTIDSLNKPSTIDELQNKSERTKEEQEELDKLNKEFNNKFVEVALPYFNEVVSMPFDGITEEDFNILVRNNNMDSIFGYEYIYNKLVKQ